MKTFFEEAARISAGIKTLNESFDFSKNGDIVTVTHHDRKSPIVPGEAMDHSKKNPNIYSESNNGLADGNARVNHILKMGYHPYRAIADTHAIRSNGKPLTKVPEVNDSSLSKQHAIGVAYDLAAKEHPEYQRRVFEAYKTQRPELIRQTGANNYHELLNHSYKALSKESDEQFKDIPLKMHFREDKFYDNSQEMMRDVHLHHAITVYSGGEHEQLGNKDEHGLSPNTRFRAVHDVIGHAIHGNQFGPKGEEIAWDTHRQTFSPLAQLALTAETRGQNSYVNYTHANIGNQEKLESIRKQKRDFVNSNPGKSTAEFDSGLKKVQENWNYAPNKTALLPPEMLHPKFSGEMPSYLKDVAKDATRPSDGDIVRMAKFHSTSSHTGVNGGVEDTAKTQEHINLMKRNYGG